MVGPERPRIVLFGSSIVQFSYSNNGWGAILADLYSRKADIILRGYAGWNSRRALQVLHQVFPKDAAVQPALVIVYFGGNDSVHPHPSGFGPHVPLSEYVDNMRKIATHLKSLSEKTRFIFLTAPPVNEQQIENCLSSTIRMVRTNESCRKYAEACIELCNDMGIKSVDIWTATQKHPHWMNVCFTDGIHFSEEGSKIVAEEILKAIEEANWEPSLDWRKMPVEFAEYDIIGPAGVLVTVANISEMADYQGNNLKPS